MSTVARLYPRHDPAHPDDELMRLRADNAGLSATVKELRRELAEAKAWRAWACLCAFGGSFVFLGLLRLLGL
jgi:hypothetical protein